VYLTHLPLYHTNALAYSALGTFWAGSTMVLLAKFSARRFWPISLRHRCTVTCARYRSRSSSQSRMPIHPTLRQRSSVRAKNLADFKVPRRVVLVSELPRATLNKVAKSVLRERLRSELALDGDGL
jgi:non-ribosomal peptide synthetase component E (peptide arylation enzyme)